MKLIELSWEQNSASITGYVTSLEQENFSNYLDEHLELSPKNKFLEYLKSQIGNGEFTLLKNLYVEPQVRGKNYGQNLMNSFLEKSHGPIVLICDNLESQAPGFNLQSWYVNNFQFVETGFVTLSGPILIRF